MISTYAELVTAIGRTANRKDADFTAAIPNFIVLAEANLRRDVRARSEVQTIDLTVDEDSYPLPCGFDGIVSVNGTGDRPREITYVSSDTMDKSHWHGFNGYTISGNSLYFGRAPGDIRLRYRAMFAPLSERNRCNWILSNAPDAYLYGALMHSAPYLEDDARLSTWGGLYRNAVQGINTQAINQMIGGPLLMRSDRAF